MQTYLNVQSLLTQLRLASSGYARDVRVTTAMPRYAACMQRAGIPSSSLSDTGRLAEKRFASRAPTAAPTLDELGLATSDARCQGEAALPQAMLSAGFDSARPWIKEHLGAIRAAEQAMSGAA